MPWKGVTVSEQRQRFLEDYKLNYYPVIELVERFSISRKTAHKWIDRFEEEGVSGYREHSRRPGRCPWQTEAAIVQELVDLRKAHPRWGPRKLLDLIHERNGQRKLPAVSTAALILARQGLARSKRRYRWAHPGCPKRIPQGPNDIWAADYKGQFRLKDGGVLLPVDRQRSGLPVSVGVRCTPGDLPGTHSRALHHALSGLWAAQPHPNRQWLAVRLQRPGTALPTVGVVHQARHLPRADRARPAAAARGAREDAPDAQAGGHAPSRRQPAGPAAVV